MSASQLERPLSVIDNSQWRRDTSFGVVYEGVVEHGNGRSNPFVETVPQNLSYPHSAVVIGGGYTSSEEHYRVVQKQLGLGGERSVLAGHAKHGHYEIGHNAEDIAMTCGALAAGGIHNVVLLGHSRGGPEVLEAHELIREMHLDTQVTDIVLAFPAEFIEHFPLELARSAPKFLIEMALGMVKRPKKQLMFGMHVVKNITTDLERTVKEGLHLLTHHSGNHKVGLLQKHENRPRLHLVVGLLDGLIAGHAVLKTFQDSESDTVTVLRSGHIDLNTAPEVTEIIHSRVRRIAA